MTISPSLPTLPLPPLLQAYTTLYDAAPRVAAVSPVVALVSAFVDVSVRISPARAAASGSALLFQRVMLSIDGFISREYALSLSLEAAIQVDDLAMVQTIHTLHPQPLEAQSLELAMAHGSLELVQWVLAHRHDRSCCLARAEEVCESCVVMALQHIGDRDTFRVASWLVTTKLLPTARTRLENNPALLTRALLQSAELVRWYDDLGFLAEPLIRELVQQSLSQPTRATPDIMRYLLARGLTPPHIEDSMDWLIRAACHPGQDELVELLLASAICDPCRDHFTYAALRPGASKVLQWSRDFDTIREANYGVKQVGFLKVRDVASLAIAAGHVDMVEWLVHEHGVSSLPLPTSAVPEKAFLAIVTMLHDAGALGLWTSPLYHGAANGYLSVVRWVHETRGESGSHNLLDIAATKGHLHVIQWLHANRSEGCSSNAMNQAASHGHLTIVQWLYENRSEGDVNAAMVYAAANGQLEVLKWLADRGSGDTCVACVRAELVAKSSSYTNSSKWSDLSPRVLYTLQWLDHHSNISGTSDCNGLCVANSIQRASMSFAAAAVAAGDLLLLQYLHEHHSHVFAWHAQDMVYRIVESGHLPVVQWLYARDRDCCDWRHVAAVAEQHQNRQLSEWLHREVLFTYE